MEKIKNIEEINKDFINDLLNELAKSRPIFHNEQDFQFELGQKIKEYIENENIVVRLEYFIGESKKDRKKDEKNNNKKRIYIDIMIIEKNSKTIDKAIAIELKYKTKESIGTCQNEKYCLKAQGADDWGCYDIYKDLSRIENLVDSDEEENYENSNLKNLSIEKGYVIFLTNDGETYKKKRKGIFKNYSLIDEEGGKKVTKDEGEIKYCHKEAEYEDYEYKDIIQDNVIDGKFINYSSIKDKEPIKFKKEKLGEWSMYSNLEKYDTEGMDDIVQKLIFEVKKGD